MLEIAVRNSQINNIGSTGNRFFLYVQFEDPEKPHVYDTLILSHLLNSTEAKPYELLDLADNDIILAEDNVNITGFGYENYTFADSKWTQL